MAQDMIAVEDITPNPMQPRTVFDAQALNELAASIAVHGVGQPISVEKAGEHSYILHDGERRWRAAKLAGLTHISAVVLPPLNGEGPETRLTRAIVLNVQRSQMHPIEEGRAYARLRDEFDLSGAQVAKNVGKSYMHVNARLRLVDLDNAIQDLMLADMFPVSPDAVKALKKLPEDLRVEFAESLVDRAGGRKVSFRQVERAASAVMRQVFQEKLADANKSIQADVKWDIFSFAGVSRNALPKKVRVSAAQSCQVCESFLQMANSNMCLNCPLVDMLKFYGGVK